MARHYHDGDDRLSNNDVEQDARFDELRLRGLYESPHLESDCLGVRLENAGELMMAARSEPEYDEFGLEIEGTDHHDIDAYWVGASLRTTQARDVDPLDLADEDLTGLPLEAQERLHGLREERKRQREKALAAHVLGIDRERRHCNDLLDEYRTRRAERTDRIVGAGTTRTNPFERLDQDAAQAVRDAALRLDEQLTTGPSLAVLEHHLAMKVVLGQDLFTAQSNTLEELYQEAGVIQPIASIPRIPSKYNVEADIQGKVTTLWQPKSSTQQQVGIVADDTGTIKFTVWTRSNQDVILHEGDTVRIVGGKVGTYNGQATLAADSKTRLIILERGDGPGPRGDIANVDWDRYTALNRTNGTDRPSQCPRPCSMPALGTPGIEEVSRPLHTPPDRLDRKKSRELDASEWLKATEIFDEEGDIPLPAWWRDQSNVVSITVGENADRTAIADTIREVVFTTDPLTANSKPQPPVPDGKRRLWVLVRNPALIRNALKESLPLVEPFTGATGDFATVESTAMVKHDIGRPTTTSRCPACSHDRAYFRVVQLRSIDEPPTRLLSCTSCGKRWREDT